MFCLKMTDNPQARYPILGTKMSLSKCFLHNTRKIQKTPRFYVFCKTPPKPLGGFRKSTIIHEKENKSFFLKQLFSLPRFKKILCKDDVAASQKGTHA